MPEPSSEPEPAPHPAVEGPEEALDAAREPAQPDPALLERVAALEAREKELLDRLARLQADFENYRRRAREDATAATQRGKEALLKGLLPALDTLDRAVAHTSDEGLRLLARQVADLLSSLGVRVVAPEGEAFDAKLHEAVAQEEREGVKAGTVLHVADKGYVLDGRVVRPARVVVAA